MNLVFNHALLNMTGQLLDSSFEACFVKYGDRVSISAKLSIYE